MKWVCIFLLVHKGFILQGQVPAKFDYPDTLWIYGVSSDSTYGLDPMNPIKVGGGELPKHVYRYLNSLVDEQGKAVAYKRVGSCCSEEIGRSEPLTLFELSQDGKVHQILFDQYEWDYPKLISGYQWNEQRMGYRGEYQSDTIFEGYGLYFFEDGGYYRGHWKSGLMEGEGEMFVPGVERYTGNFQEGLYHGYGVLDFLDGGRYEGDWKQGNKSGFGRLVYPPESEIEWIEGQFKEDEPTGTFTIQNRDGTQETYTF
ncbi:MAG: hypothetical protein AAGH79_18355 [Bacteroidota bacterium]